MRKITLFAAAALMAADTFTQEAAAVLGISNSSAANPASHKECGMAAKSYRSVHPGKTRGEGHCTGRSG